MAELGAVQLALGIAVGAGKVGSTLYQLFKDVKKDRENAMAFAGEVEDLADACANVGELIRVCQSEPRDDLSVTRNFERFWRVLKKSLDKCYTTVQCLEIAVSKSSLTSQEQPSVFTRVIIQIQNNKKAKDLQEVRNRIQTHTTSLQIALHVLEVRLVSTAPQLISEKLESRLMVLECKSERLQRLKSSPKRQQTAGDTEWDLLKLSRDVISSAKSQYTSSVAPSACSIPPSLIPTAAARRPSQVVPSHVGSWIKDQGATQRVPSEPSTPQTEVSSVFSRPQPSRHPSTADTITTGTRSPERPRRQPACLDFGSDDEAEVDDLKNAIKYGRSSFLEANYHEASARLQVAEMEINKLPSKRQRFITAYELRYMLAVCAFHLRAPSESVEPLEDFLKYNFEDADTECYTSGDPPLEPGDSTKNALQHLHVKHLLAIVHLRLGNVQHARSSCKAARYGRRKYLGPEAPLYYESTALMAAIEDAEGNTNQASNILSAIDDSRRDEMVQAIAALTVSQVIGAGTSRAQSVDLAAALARQPSQGYLNVAGVGLGIEDSERSSICSPTDPESRRPSLPYANDNSHPLADYRGFYNSSLGNLARSMRHCPTRPASFEIRQEWAKFLGIDLSKLRPMSKALFNGDMREAMELTSPRSMTQIVPEDRHIAALFGDFEISERLCLHTLNTKHVWKVGPGKLTALHCAAIGGNRKIAALLMSKGCPVNENLPGFGTPLSLAALGQRFEVIDELLSHYAGETAKSGKLELSLDAECHALGSVVHAAVASGSAGLVDALVEDERPFETSQKVDLQGLRSLRKMLQIQSASTAADAYREPSNNDPDAAFESVRGQPLAIASYFGCEATVEHLCTRGGVDINALCSASLLRKSRRSESTKNHSALTLASMQRNETVVALLISSGANAESAYRARGGRSGSSLLTR